MANNVTILSYANTFGDWVVTTNALAKENNDLAANNYVKPTGTLFLNSPTLGLQVANSAIIAGTLQVQGVGSSAYVQNNLRVDGTIYVPNTSLSIVASGQANIGGPILAMSSGTGLSVSNNAIVGGTLAVTGATSLSDNLSVTKNATVGGTLAVTGATTVSNTVSITGATIVSNELTVTGNTNTSKTSSANNLVSAFNTNTTTLTVMSSGTIGSSLSVGTDATITGNVIVGSKLTTDVLQTNSSVNTSTISVTGIGYLNVVQANTLVNTSTLTVTNSAIVNNLQANTNVNTPSVTTTNVRATGNVIANIVQANTSISSPVISSGSIFANNVQANIALTTTSLSVTGTANVANLVANNSITVPTIFVTSKLDANAALVSYFNNITTTGQLSVGGNFVLNGPTVYNSNNFTINANSAVGQISTFNVNRGSSGANASIRWNESTSYWDILNVSNSLYYKILTNDLLSDSISSTSSTNIATSNAVKLTNDAISTANTSMKSYVDTANTSMKSYVDVSVTTANTNLRLYTNANITANLNTARAYTDTANTYLQNYNTTVIFPSISVAYARANTSPNIFIGTSGSANATGGITTFTSTNGVTIVGSSNTVTFNTAQDIRSTATPTFANLVLTNALPIIYGGTGATSAASALTNLLPSASGVPAGYVLATGGVGSYYWAAGGTGGGGGATPGTTINSTRSIPTVNAGQTIFTTPTYVVGASQLRVYRNGVRQYNSDYTETNSTTVTLLDAAVAGEVILIEVDGYINNPYYANNITFTAPFGGIVSTANTIQLAIQDLETRKATLAGPSFTGIVTSVTPSTDTSNTQIATTAFVKNSLNNSNTYTMSVTGNAGTVTNGVYTAGNQTIAGVKTFSSTISGSIDGNAGTVTNGVYTSGSYSNPSWITSIAYSKVTGLTADLLNLGSANNVQHGTLGVGTTPDSSNTGSIRATGDITAYYSDERLKTNLGTIENALEKVSSLTGFYYEANKIAQDLGYTVKREVGVSAQQVQKVLPEIVAPAPIDDKYLTIHYERLVPLLIEAIKELKAEVDALKGNK